jgi:hypothetical protein
MPPCTKCPNGLTGEVLVCEKAHYESTMG